MHLQHDARIHWESQCRRRAKQLEMAQQELFTARAGAQGAATVAKQMAVIRAKRALTEAQEKLDLVKKWNRQYESETKPLVKQLERLQGFLAIDLRRGAGRLANSVRALEAYAERTSAGPAPAQVPPAQSPSEAGDDIPEDTRVRTSPEGNHQG
jgi:hypothetical protein